MQLKSKNIKPKKATGFAKWAFLGGFLLLLSAAFFFANKYIQTKSYSNLFDFAWSTSKNYISSFKANTEVLSITIAPDDFKKLEEKRELALKRRLIINEEGSYVPAVVEHDGKKTEVKLRLKGHMTDHVESDKWSFRIKTKGKGHVMGMRALSIQQPGTRGYVYEWVYHTLLKELGVIALRYKFVQVNINGKNKGIFALEEHFDEELVVDNGRPIGPIFRFNPNLYWVDRYNGVLNDRVNAEFALMSSANFESYREKKMLDDPLQVEYFLKGTALMEAFRRGELPADSVFDLDKQAKFYAVMDLLGGHFSMDWSDVKFYYNPVISRLEPVGFESCSLFPTRRLAGTYEYSVNNSHSSKEEFHALLFRDELFYRKYVGHVEKISQKHFLDKFFEKYGDELEENLNIVYKDYPYKKFDKDLYYKNQLSIKRILDTPKAFHAFYEGRGPGEILLQIGMVESLPVEIMGLMYKDTFICDFKRPQVLPSKAKGDNIQYQPFSFPVPEGLHLKDKNAKHLSVAYRILGGSALKKAEVFPYPYVSKSKIANHFLNMPSNVQDFHFLVKDENKKTVFILPGNWEVRNNIVIPPGYVLKGDAGTRIDLLGSSMIVSYSPVEFKGTEEYPLVITSSDHTGMGLFVLRNSEESVLRQVHFINLNASRHSPKQLTGAVTFYEAGVTLSNCLFSGGRNEDALTIMRSGFFIRDCVFENLENDAIDIKNSNGRIINTSFLNCREDGIDVTAGQVELRNLYFNHIGNKGINAKAHAEVKANGLAFSNSGVAISAEDFANVVADKVNITEGKFAFVAYQNKPLYGPASITAGNAVFDKSKHQVLQEVKSFIKINDIKQSAEIKNVEQVLKGYRDE